MVLNPVMVSNLDGRSIKRNLLLVRSVRIHPRECPLRCLSCTHGNAAYIPSFLQLQRMFDHHRKSPWFAEKYDPSPEYEKMRARVRERGWRGRIDQFVVDLDTGKYDPDLNEPEPEAAAPVKDNVPNGETADGTETNYAQAAAPVEAKANANGDDEMQFNVEAEDEGGDNDANRGDTNGKSSSDNRRNNRGEEISVQPEGNQVMIRTIPPDIGRAKLEDVSIIDLSKHIM